MTDRTTTPHHTTWRHPWKNTKPLHIVTLVINRRMTLDPDSRKTPITSHHIRIHHAKWLRNTTPQHRAQHTTLRHRTQQTHHNTTLHNKHTTSRHPTQQTPHTTTLIPHHNTVYNKHTTSNQNSSIIPQHRTQQTHHTTTLARHHNTVHYKHHNNIPIYL